MVDNNQGKVLHYDDQKPYITTTAHGANETRITHQLKGHDILGVDSPVTPGFTKVISQ